MTTSVRILVVDGNENRAQKTCRLLEQAGYVSVLARNEREALESIASSPPDLALFDRDMPGIESLEVLRQLKHDPIGASVFVVLVSDLTLSNEEQVAGLEAGADGYLQRPMGDRELVARVEAFIRPLRRSRALLDAAITAQTQSASMLASLRESEEYFRAIFTQAPLGIALIDSQTGRILEVNTKFALIAGRKRDAMMAMDWMSITHPEDVQDYWDHLALLTARKIAGFQLNTRYLRPDATIVWVSMVIVSLQNNGQLPPRHVCMIEDTTSRKQAEAALQESQANLARAESFSHILVTQISLDGRWLKAPPALCQLLGYTEAELLARRIQDISHPKDAETDWRQYQLLLESDLKAFSSEKRVCHKDGSTLWFDVNTLVVTDADGNPQHFLTYFRDITAYKQNAEKLIAQAALLDLTPDAISVRDFTGQILYWNRGAEHLFGWTSAEVLAANNPSLLATVNGLQFDVCLAHTLATGGWQGELHKTNKAGQELIVQSRWTLLKHTSGVPQSILVVDTDITEQKNLESHLLRTQRLESIGTLASGLAHDLNNILAPIMMSSMLLRELQSPEAIEKTTRLIESSAQRGASIVKQLLTFGRGTSGEHIAIELKHLIKEMAKITQETFPKNLTIRYTAGADLWPLIGDPTQLHQVLLNLCINARDAMPNGGTLSIKAENVQFDEQYAHMNPAAKPGPYVRLEVSDTGVGIPPENLEKIFDPFFTTKEPGKGTGLGLATVINVIKRHGGFIQVHSKVGQGTTFEACLPAAPAEQVAAAASPSAALQKRGHGEWILVVDDEPEILEVLRNTLENQGYRVLAAADGTEALVGYFQHPDDIKLVLTDLMMPNLDGQALARALRRLKPELMIIVSSGLTDGLNDMKKGQFQAMGIEHFLMKPYAANRLLDMIHHLLHPDG